MKTLRQKNPAWAESGEQRITKEPTKLGFHEVIRKLKEDPMYRDPTFVMRCLRHLKGELRPTYPSLNTEDLALDLKDLVSTLYEKKLDLEVTQIEREEFKRLLRDAGLLLPDFWFGNEPDSSSEYVRRVDKEKSEGFFDEEIKEYRKIKKKIEELEGLNPQTVTESLQKDEKLETFYARREQLEASLKPTQGMPGIEQKESIDTTEQGKSIKEAEYAYLKIGSTWKMVWAGKEIINSRQGGFKYFHYCMEHPEGKFEHIDLHKLLNKSPVAHSKGCPSIEELKEGFSFGDLKGFIERQPIITFDTITKIREYSTELNKEIEDKIKGGDNVEKLRAEKEAIEEYMLECERHGRLKVFHDTESKISNTIGKAMSRALQELRKANEEAYTHFYKAFKPINSSTKKYNPTNPIPWVLKK
jgi:hypothetical protein